MMTTPRTGTAGPNSVVIKRIKKEIAELAKEDTGGIVLKPNESNILSWKAVLPGPSGSPYEGGVFDVDIRVPDDYPFSPPQLQFITRVYHCNIASTGAICLDLLKHNWSPALSLYKVILSLSSLLTDPNPADPLVPNIAQQYKRDRKKHDQTARDWVQMYALPKPAPSAKTPAIAAAVPARPRFTRPSSSTSSSITPVPQIAGTRRSRANGSRAGAEGGTVIELNDSEEELAAASSDVEVVGEASTRDRRTGRSHANGNGHGSTSTAAGRPTKRTRTEADDVIVVDD